MKKNGLKNRNKTLIIGAGNEFRTDDGVGIWIARKFRGLDLPGVTVMEADGDGTKLTEAWKDYPNVFVFDAVLSQDGPGTIYRFDVDQDAIPKNYFRYSTHAFGLLEAVELSRALERLPSRLIVFGVTGKIFQAGIGLSPEVEHSARALFRQGLEEIHARNGAIR